MHPDMDLSDEEIYSLIMMETEATEGPWLAQQTSEIMYPEMLSRLDQIIRGSKGMKLNFVGNGLLMTGCMLNGPTSETNAVFVAAMRNALPRLLGEIRRRRKEMEHLTPAPIDQAWVAQLMAFVDRGKAFLGERKDPTDGQPGWDGTVEDYRPKGQIVGGKKS